MHNIYSPVIYVKPPDNIPFKCIFIQFIYHIMHNHGFWEKLYYIVIKRLHALDPKVYFWYYSHNVLHNVLINCIIICICKYTYECELYQYWEILHFSCSYSYVTVKGKVTSLVCTYTITCFHKLYSQKICSFMQLNVVACILYILYLTQILLS